MQGTGAGGREIGGTDRRCRGRAAGRAAGRGRGHHVGGREREIGRARDRGYKMSSWRQGYGPK